MKIQFDKYLYIGTAVLAAALYGLSAPFSKLLLKELSPYLLSAMLYLGAGIGMFVVDRVMKFKKSKRNEDRLTRQELPYIILMVLLDILAPVLLMFGLQSTSSATAALLNNFEIVATTFIAFVIFKEVVSKRIVIAITLITVSSIILSIEDFSSLTFSFGAILILLAALSWGFENNCTRKLSSKDPLQIVMIKGIGSGLGALLLAIFLNQFQFEFSYLIFALILGFFAYGLSIFFYVISQRHLGAARTSAYYAVAPFIGVIISFIVFAEPIQNNFLFAATIMVIGTYLAVTETQSQSDQS